MSYDIYEYSITAYVIHDSITAILDQIIPTNMQVNRRIKFKKQSDVVVSYIDIIDRVDSLQYWVSFRKCPQLNSFWSDPVWPNRSGRIAYIKDLF